MQTIGSSTSTVKCNNSVVSIAFEADQQWNATIWNFINEGRRALRKTLANRPREPTNNSHASPTNNAPPTPPLRAPAAANWVIYRPPVTGTGNTRTYFYCRLKTAKPSDISRVARVEAVNFGRLGTAGKLQNESGAVKFHFAINVSSFGDNLLIVSE